MAPVKRTMPKMAEDKLMEAAKAVNDEASKKSAETAQKPAEAAKKRKVKTPAPKGLGGKNDSEMTDAEKFQKFVNDNRLAISKDNKMYLLAEAWQFVMSLKGLRLNIRDVRETRSGEFLRVLTIVDLIDGNGVNVSSGVMEASNQEEWLKDKSDFAVYGLSQTRAMSRAVRNKYGYLAKACGFEATPYDEMPKGEA